MSGYIGTQPVPQATQTRDVFTATSGQTSFATSGYTPNFLDVWLNGVKLVNGDDFTATNGSDVVLTSGATAGDTVEVLAFSTFTPSDAATALQGALADTAVQASGDTMTGNLAFGDYNAATFGTGNDLQIWHGGWSSHVKSYNKSLYLMTGSSPDDDVVIQGYDVYNGGFGVANYLLADSGTGEVTLYNQGFPKLVTKTDGIQVNGGVYLGGTGAANLLDDYEEGSWTPTIRSFSGPSATMSLQYGTYTKVGKLVTISARLSTTDVPSSGPVLVGGLPFNPTSSVNDYPIGAVFTQSVSYGTGTHVLMMVPNGAPFLQPMIGGADYNAHQIGPADVGAFGFYMAFSVTYRTD